MGVYDGCLMNPSAFVLEFGKHLYHEAAMAIYHHFRDRPKKVDFDTADTGKIIGSTLDSFLDAVGKHDFPSALAVCSPGLRQALGQRPALESALCLLRGVAPDANGNCPAGYPIKGSRAGVFHMPGGRLYVKTRPVLCFANESQAKTAGYRASQQR